MEPENPKETTQVFKPISKKGEKPAPPPEVLTAYADMIGDREEKKQEFDPPPWEDPDAQEDDKPINRFW